MLLSTDGRKKSPKKNCYRVAAGMLPIFMYICMTKYLPPALIMGRASPQPRKQSQGDEYGRGVKIRKNNEKCTKVECYENFIYISDQWN